MIKLLRKRDGFIYFDIPEEKKSFLETARLRGCPFKNYYAWDLLIDLVKMYSWKMEYNKIYDISDFLELCNCAHAIAYKSIFA